MEQINLPTALEEILSQYEEQPFLLIRHFISVESAQQLLRATDDVPLREVICGDESIRFGEQNFPEEHPLFKFFLRQDVQFIGGEPTIIHLREEQDIPGTEAFLQRLGVDPKRIGVDRVRGVGRGFNLTKEDAISALCGKCVSGQCVITAEGTVYPCIMARSFPLGSVLEQTITAILTGEPFKATCEVLNAAFAARHRADADCNPDYCNPDCRPYCDPICNPNCRPTDCNPI